MFSTTLRGPKATAPLTQQKQADAEHSCSRCHTNEHPCDDRYLASTLPEGYAPKALVVTSFRSQAVRRDRGQYHQQAKSLHYKFHSAVLCDSKQRSERPSLE